MIKRFCDRHVNYFQLFSLCVTQVLLSAAPNDGRLPSEPSNYVFNAKDL